MKGHQSISWHLPGRSRGNTGIGLGAAGDGYKVLRNSSGVMVFGSSERTFPEQSAISPEVTCHHHIGELNRGPESSLPCCEQVLLFKIPVK